MIKIDGRTFNVPIISVSRKADFLYSFADRNEMGVMLNEEIGLYINTDYEARNVKRDGEYDALFAKICEAKNDHVLTVYLGGKEVPMRVYFSGIGDSLVSINNGIYYNNLKFKAIAFEPLRGIKL